MVSDALTFHGAAYAGVAVGVFGLLCYAASLAAAAHRPVAQALSRLVTLVPAYLHELAHAALSIAFTGQGRIRLYSVKRASERGNGQVALGDTDVYYWGPLSNALVSAAPALLLWPLALLLVTGMPGAGSPSSGGLGEAALVGMLAFAGRLSASDRAHALRPWRRQPRA
jgi:hypothetical protein